MARGSWIKFDRVALLAQLRPMASQLVTVFAASIAQRIVTGMRVLQSADDDLLRRVEAHASSLDALWSDLAHESPDLAMLTIIRDATLGLIPYEDDDSVALIAEAQESGSTVAYALESRLTSDPEQACWASQAMYDYLDGYVILRDDLDIRDPNLTSRVLQDPILQQEFEREARDLHELKAAVPASIAQIARNFQARSKAEGTTLLVRPA